eukprot:13575241-Alexandrium_andersonii.AAC.1
MSASLVGSEMCIRDSPHPHPRLSGTAPPPRTPEKRLRGARQPVSSSPSDSACEMTPNPPDEVLIGWSSEPILMSFLEPR